MQMKKIKFLTGNRISLDGVIYKPYLLSELPNSFGVIWDENREDFGISQWFNYKGLTYVRS